MGGVVQVAIRLNDKLKKDGEQEVYNMCRYVNNVSDYFLDNKFFEEDRGHLDDYLSSWLRMKSDYEKHKEDKKFEIENTHWYFPHDNFVPISYGSIVVDYKTKTILSMQNYTSILFLRPERVVDNTDYNIKSEFFNYIDFNRYKYFDKSEMQSFNIERSSKPETDATMLLKNNPKTLHDKFSDFETFNKVILESENKRSKKYAEIVNNRDEKSDLIRKKIDDDYWNNLIFIYPDLDNWNFIYYEENNEGSRFMLKKLLELGFNISEEEQKIWNNFYLEEEG